MLQISKTTVRREETEQLTLDLRLDPLDEKPTKTKRTYRKRTARKTTSIVAKGKTTVSIPSDPISREILNGLCDPRSFTYYQDMGLAEHHHTFKDGKGNIIITIKPAEGEDWETILIAIDTLGDGIRDTFAALLVLTVEQNGFNHLRESVITNLDEILELCDKKDSNGSYTAAKRAEITRHLKTLSQTRVIATFPANPNTPRKRGRRRGGAPASDPTIIKVEGSLIHLHDFKIGEYDAITGREIWEKQAIALGEWANDINLIKESAIMLRKVLAYSTTTQRYQKRLGLYITMMFRINVKNGIVFTRSMDALLKGAGIVPDWQRGRFKDAIERALQDLQKDNIIAKYEQVVEAGPDWQTKQQEIHERARDWWEKYMSIQWRFYPPDYAIEQYSKIEYTPKEIESTTTTKKSPRKSSRKRN